MVISAIVPSEEPALLPYCIKESEEQSDCETIGSDSNIEEINKTEVHNILKELAGLRRKEAECFDRLAQAVPDMQDNEVIILAEKVRGSELPQCVYQMNQRIDNPRNFRAALAVGEVCTNIFRLAHPQPPYQTFVHTLMLVKLSCMSCYEVGSTSTPRKKREKPRRSQCGESGQRGLKRHPQRRRARRPRLPPPLKTVR